MPKSKPSKTELRQQAEEKLSQRQPSPITDTDTRRLIHELEVHQIELEMQNEELLQARAESEEAYRQYADLYDLAPVGYFTLAQDGAIQQVNLTGASLLGTERDKLIKRRLGVFVAVESRPVLSDFLEKLFSAPVRQATCEVALLQTGPTTRWVRIEATCDNHPCDTGRAIVSDITERKLAKDTLHDSEARFREVLENSLAASYKRNLHTNAYDYLSPVFEKLSGYAAEEFRTLPTEVVLDLMHPDDVAEVERVLAAALADSARTAFQVDYRFKHKAGHYRWVHDQFIVMRDAQGHPLARIGSVSDITDRKQAELAEYEARQLAEALRDTAAVLNSTLDLDEVLDRILTNVESVVAHDTANLMLIDDQSVARIVRHRGYAERGLTDFAACVRLPVAEVPNLQHMATTGQPRVMPNVRLEPDWLDWPESRWIQSMASAPIRLKDTTIGFINLNSGTPNFYSSAQGERLQAFANQVAVAVENARLYEQIQLYSQQLEQRVADRTAELQAANLHLIELDHLKDDFLSRTNHELRTPLSGILISLELLEIAQPDKRDRYMQRLKQSADRMRDMVEDVLMFSELDRYLTPEALGATDLNNLIAGRATAWRALSATHNLALQLDLAPDLPHARVDGELFTHALTRLVTNAVNYTPAGSISVSTALRTEADQRWVTISVRDTGPGITPEDLPHIFERFYRGRAAADYKTPGTGIGLSISREIIEKLGGRLTVETQVGVGSTFILWLKPA